MCGECDLKIIPVIDVKEGIVVRGVAGERGRYRPVESRLTDGSEVLDVAEALRSTFGLPDLYVADLDAILNDRPHLLLYRELADRGFRLLVDAGLRDVNRAAELTDCGVDAVVAALETSPGPQHLAEICAAFGPERIVFSLDLKNGRPMFAAEAWKSAATSGDAASETADELPLRIAAIAADAGVRRMIVLDLAAVGVGEGPATIGLCRTIRERNPGIELITGGGVRDAGDLQRLHESGVNGVLVASALHNGAISPDQIAPFQSERRGRDS